MGYIEGDDMDFKDLSLTKKLLLIMLLILLSPLLLGCVIFIVIRVPFEYPEYKKSRYYKKYKQKYSIGITYEEFYKVINYLEQENIKYDSFDVENEELRIGDTTYLFPWFECISFDEDGNLVVAEQDNFEPTLLANEEKVKGRKNIKIIINKKEFYDLDLTRSGNTELLLMYDDIADLEKELR